MMDEKNHWIYKHTLTRNPNHSFAVLIPEKDKNDIIFEYEIWWDDKVLTRLATWIRYKNLCLKKGDVIQLSWEDYKNNGTYFWDGEEVINISLEYDETGNVPEEWNFPEFPIKYFDKILRWNSICWIDEYFENIIIKNMTYGKPPFQDKKIIYSWFESDNNDDTFRSVMYFMPDDMINLITEFSKERYWVFGICQDDTDNFTEDEIIEHSVMFRENKVYSLDDYMGYYQSCDDVIFKEC